MGNNKKRVKGVVKMPKDKKTGLYYRNGTTDLDIIREQKIYILFFEKIEGLNVLDVGANIGTFTHNLIENGAKQVYAFEPEPENIKMFKKQNFGNKVRLFESAISNKNGTSKLYLNTKKNKGTHSLNKIRGREPIEVETKSFKKVFEKLKIDAIKIDIEGAEYLLDFKQIPDTVKYIAIEVHMSTKENREKGKQLINYLQKRYDTILMKKCGFCGCDRIFIGELKT